MVDTLVGRYRLFSEYLAAAVARRLHLAGIPEVDRYTKAAVTAAGQMPPFPEVEPSLVTLRGAGLRIASITNSPTEVAVNALREAGLLQYFEYVVGSDHPRAYKPAPVVYRTGLERMGAEPGRACMGGRARLGSARR
jgi:2-haloacid dehalogenase